MKPAFVFSLFLLGLFTAAPWTQVRAQSFGTLRDFVRKDMKAWTKADTSVLVASCLETRHETDQDGKKWLDYSDHVILFPPGSAKGKYVLFEWKKKQKPSDAQAMLDGTLSILARAPHVKVDLPDQGGPWEYGYAAMVGEYLLRRPMTLVAPNDFLKAISTPSTTPCPDFEPTSAVPGTIERFYRKQGWYGPLPLPSVDTPAR